MQVISFLDEESPKKIGAFKIKWISDGGYRGHYEVNATKKSGYKLIDSDWITGDWSDAGEHASSKVMAKVERLEKELGKEIVVVLSLTSNIFAQGYDLFVKQ